MKNFLSLTLLSASSLIFADNINLSSELQYTKTIKSGTHTAMENQLNSEYCKSIGGVDVTDLSDIQLTSNASNPVICIGTGAGANLGTVSDNAFLTTLSAETFSGTIEFAPYSVGGRADYTNGRIGAGIAMRLSVPADNCGVTGANITQEVSGLATLQVTCSYPSSRGSRQDIMEASYLGINARGTGTITIR